MSRSDSYKTTATDHRKKHHGHTVPDVHSNDGNTNAPKAKHEEDKQAHRKEEKQRNERRTAVKTKTASKFTALALAIVGIFSIAAKNQAWAATFKPEFVKNEFVKTETFKNEFFKNEFFKSEFFKNDVTKNEFAKNEFEKNKFEKNEFFEA